MGQALTIIESAVQVIASGTDSGSSAGEIVAIVLAAASFVISVGALYATALKRAKIGIHQSTNDRPWQISGGSELTPVGEHYVMVSIYAHNSGANAGILEDVEVTSESTLSGLLSQPVSWYPVKTSAETHPSNARAHLPQGIDAGEIQELFFIGRVPLSLGPIQRLHPDEQADMEREETFARQLYDAKTLPVTVTWRYARPPALGLALNQPPTTKTGTLTAEVPVAGLRDHFVVYWESQTHHAVYEKRACRLASIAITGQPSDPPPGDEGIA